MELVSWAPDLQFIEETRRLKSKAIPRHPEIVDDVAPADRWNYDLMESEGEATIKRIVEDVKSMCSAPADGKVTSLSSKDNSNYPNVFFDTTINDEPAGRIVFKLKDDVVPKTAKNFRELATGQHGLKN